MKVSVLLFAAARDIAGTNSITVELAEPATVEQLRRKLNECLPAANDLLVRSSISINHQYAVDNTVIHPTDEIALIPPVSGG